MLICAPSFSSTCAISLIRLSYLKQGPDFTFDNIPTSCWSVGELAAGTICASLPTLRPLASKIKPSWINSYGTRRGYGAGGSKAYGDGGFGIAGDSRVAHSHRSRSQRDSVMTSSTLMMKNYNKLQDHDIERALCVPALPSPTYKFDPKSRSDTSLSDDSEERMAGNGIGNEPLREGREDVPMQQFQPRPKLQVYSTSESTSKAHQVLGMGMARTGVSTKVVGGLGSTASTYPNGGSRSFNSKAGIEVKRVITVTRSDADQDRFGI